MSDLNSEPTPTVIRWEDPPRRERSTGKRDWTGVAEELRSNPFRWAVVYDGSLKDARTRVARGIASGISSATLTAFRPAGSYEALSRMVGERTLVYARFVGEHYVVEALQGEEP